MKLSLLAFLPAVLALPAADSSGIASRQTAVATTDNYIFTLTLPQFTVRRNNRNPASLDWSSDGCSNSPDNPFGFPFTPACHRHDFGYRNYKKQSRFTDANRKRIDDKFKVEYVPVLWNYRPIEWMLTMSQSSLPVQLQRPRCRLPCSGGCLPCCR